jgi:hypothetical protein
MTPPARLRPSCVHLGDAPAQRPVHQQRDKTTQKLGRPARMSRIPQAKLFRRSLARPRRTGYRRGRADPPCANRGRSYRRCSRRRLGGRARLRWCRARLAAARAVSRSRELRPRSTERPGRSAAQSPNAIERRQETICTCMAYSPRPPPPSPPKARKPDGFHLIPERSGEPHRPVPALSAARWRRPRPDTDSTGGTPPAWCGPCPLTQGMTGKCDVRRARAQGGSCGG